MTAVVDLVLPSGDWHCGGLYSLAVEFARPADAAISALQHIAAGFDIERWFKDGQAVGTGGIINSQPTRLPSG